MNLLCMFLSIAFINYVNCADTTCQESQKQFANLCFSPNPFSAVDFQWTQNSQPADGWHVELGNDIARLHFSEVLRGKTLSLTDNFDDTCFRVRIDHGKEDPSKADGIFYGHGKLTSNWKCNTSMDFPGVLMCDISSTSSSIYHEYIHGYVSYSDNKNLQIMVMCFPQGQVGWVTATITKTISDTERKTVSDHIKSLGFSDGNTVTLYNPSCSNGGK